MITQFQCPGCKVASPIKEGTATCTNTVSCSYARAQSKKILPSFSISALMANGLVFGLSPAN